MPELINKDSNQKDKLNSFDYLGESIGWIQIVASPLLVGIIVGGIVYLLIGNTAGVILGIVVAIIGLIIGIVLANKIWKKKGTIHFISRVNASPELDNLESESTEDKQHKK